MDSGCTATGRPFCHCTMHSIPDSDTREPLPTVKFEDSLRSCDIGSCGVPRPSLAAYVAATGLKDGRRRRTASMFKRSRTAAIHNHFFLDEPDQYS